MLYDAFKQKGYKKNKRTHNIIGCSFNFLLNHLNGNEFGFKYGDDNIDIDHIVPLSKGKTEKEIIMLNNYKNLQLLPSKYNRHIKRDNEFNINDLKKWLKDD